MAKNNIGRPSEYEEKHRLFALSYLITFQELGDVVPTIEGLCDELHIGKQTCYRWAETHDDFRDALDQIKTKQGRLLQSGGLAGKTQPVITKLMLSANHGMAEKTENKNEHTGKDGVPLTVNVINYSSTSVQSSPIPATVVPGV